MQKIRDKAIVKFDADIYSQTFLIYMTSNIKKYQIPIGKLRHHHSILLFIGLIQICMVIGLIGDLYDKDKHPDFTREIPFAGKLVRFVCFITMHLKLVPQFFRGMKLMKFANNQPD